MIWKIWFMIYMMASTIFFYPFLFILVVVFKSYRVCFHTVYKAWAWSICIAIGIIPRIKNRKKIPKDEAYVMVSNHSSQLDIVVPYTRINSYFAFLAKEELKKAPLFKTNFRGMNVTVNRKDLISGKGALLECAEKLKKNVNLLIFPEGTRSKTAPVMKPFKTGPFKLAIESQVPIVPVVFLDNYKRLEGGDIWFGKCGPGQSRMVVLDPISTKGKTQADIRSLSTEAFQQIEACLKSYKIV